MPSYQSKIDKQKKIQALKDAVQFCPQCKQKLKPLGVGGDVLTCPEMHGSMTLLGAQHGNSQVKAVFELFEE